MQFSISHTEFGRFSSGDSNSKYNIVRADCTDDAYL